MAQGSGYCHLTANYGESMEVGERKVKIKNL